MTIPAINDEARLPRPYGPLSAAVCHCLHEPASYTTRLTAPVGAVNGGDLDLQLALYLCYELHYRGFSGVDPAWEWNPDLLQLRTQLEAAFLADLRSDLGRIPTASDAITELDKLTDESVDDAGVSSYLRDSGTWEQMREYFVHRSFYQLKEGDPHAWVIPRLTGQAKASLVAIEFDEYGAGHGRRVHQQLFADLMVAAGLDARYLAYLEVAPAEALAVVNLMSLFGLHRRWRGALVGHFAATEITSSPGAHRLVAALERMRAPRPCVEFYGEHVEADAVHEQVVRDVVSDLVVHEPELDHDVVFGVRAREVVEGRLANLMMSSWQSEHSSLRPAPA